MGPEADDHLSEQHDRAGKRSADFDAGKKVSLFNPNNLRIRRVTADKGPSSSANFINVSTTTYNAFLIQAGNPPVFQLYPILNPAQTVTMLYHAIAPVLVNGGSPTVPWPYQWMDDLLVDYAELDIKRVFNMRGNIDDSAGQRWQARLITATKIFSSERESTGPLEEQQTAEAEKVNLGVN